MKKIFKAMEMIATSRINKARNAAQAAGPYANALTRVVTAVATQKGIQHPLIYKPHEFGTYEHRRSAILVVTSDRGLAGSYSSAILRRTESLIERLRSNGQEVQLYLVGRKRPYARAWEGHTDAPRVETAVEIRDALLEAYDLPFEEGGVDELHIVYTEFKSMVVQEPKILRLLPIHVGEAKALGEEIVPDQELTKAEYEQAASFEFEPSAEEVLNALLPRYIASRIFSCLLQAAASELASRQRAMKTAGDNAETLITKYTRLMNNARQAEITQELSEIVGGADALGS